MRGLGLIFLLLMLLVVACGGGGEEVHCLLVTQLTVMFGCARFLA